MMMMMMMMMMAMMCVCVTATGRYDAAIWYTRLILALQVFML